MAYGIGVVHDPRKPKVAKALAVNQNKGLRTVLGAYKATPIRNLELEAYCPPLDIYFNKRLADFQQRIRGSPLETLISNACSGVKAALKNRRGPPKRQRTQYLGTNLDEWTRQWLAGSGNEGSAGALRRDWKQRWEQGAPQRTTRRAADTALPKAFEGSHLKLYENLNKAQSSIICQARTGKIGLRAFLYNRRVPGVDTPECPCGSGPQTAEHLFCECNDPRSRPLRDIGYTTAEGVREALSSPSQVLQIARGVIASGWLQEYRLAEKLGYEEALEVAAAGYTRRPPPERHKKRRPRRPLAP